MKKPRLVPEWKRSLRWYSQQVNIALISVGPVWMALPEDMRAAVPPEWLAYFVATLGLLGFVGRIISQEPQT